MNITPELLRRYHLNQCTEDEREAVDTWLEEDNIAIAHEVPAVSPSDIAKSRADMWEFLEERIPAEDVQAAKHSRRIPTHWLPHMAAAVLLITLTTIGVVRYGVKPPKQDEIILHTDVPYGKKKILTLGDGTKVYLNAGTTLHYPQSFSGHYREVELVGEAYFEVTASEKNPFIIHTSYGTQIKVVGTAFNVRAEPHSPRVEVAVSEGMVHFMTGSNPKNFLKLKAGQFAIYDSATDSFAEGYASIPFIGHWKENKLVFDQEPLEDAFRKIEKWYGYKIVVSQKQLLRQRYSARYDAPKLEELLKSMSFVLAFQYKIDDKDKIINIY